MPPRCFYPIWLWETTQGKGSRQVETEPVQIRQQPSFYSSNSPGLRSDVKPTRIHGGSCSKAATDLCKIRVFGSIPKFSTIARDAGASPA